MRKYTIEGHTGSAVVFTAATKAEYLRCVQQFVGERMIFPIEIYDKMYELGVDMIRCESGRVLFKREPYLQ